MCVCAYARVHMYVRLCACTALRSSLITKDTIGINKNTNQDKALIWRESSKDNDSVYVSARMCTNDIHLKVICLST